MKSDLIIQYQKSLLMLRDAIEVCPEVLWDNEHYANRYWRIVYHALFYTDLYLSADQNSFTPWTGHLPGYNFLGDTNFLDETPINITRIYTQTDLMQYADLLISNIEQRINDNLSKPSGFRWILLSKGGLHLYNIRHLQNHIGQLVERLRSVGIVEVKWR